MTDLRAPGLFSPSFDAAAPAAQQLSQQLAMRRAITCNSVLDLIGCTPLVRLSHLEPKGVAVWAKCEFCNPGGSVKDRPALQMVRDALADGRLTLDGKKTLIDATSGNTGVAY